MATGMSCSLKRVTMQSECVKPANPSGGEGKPIPSLPAKYPKHIKDGPSMNYSECAFPKPRKRAKKKGWGKKSG